MLSTSKLKSYQAMLSDTSYAVLFAAISSLLSDTAVNQNGGNSLEFQRNIRPNLKTFSQKCLKL